MRTCRVCGGQFPDAFFHRTHSGTITDVHIRNYRRAVCKGCEQQRRDGAKQSLEGRAQKKAYNALRLHASRLGRTMDELKAVYGWDVAQMAHDILHAHTNGCPYCRHPFAEMAHGLADVTLDIVDPKAEPYYRTNVRWVCHTCNTEKQRTPPDEWAENLRGRDMWAAWQRKRQEDEWTGTLFAKEHRIIRPDGQIGLF